MITYIEQVITNFPTETVMRSKVYTSGNVKAIHILLRAMPKGERYWID